MLQDAMAGHGQPRPASAGKWSWHGQSWLALGRERLAMPGQDQSWLSMSSNGQTGMDNHGCTWAAAAFWNRFDIGFGFILVGFGQVLVSTGLVMSNGQRAWLSLVGQLLLNLEDFWTLLIDLTIGY